MTVVSPKDFGGAYKKKMGTMLCLSATYHLPTNGKSERTIQALEDMLRTCALEFQGNWDDHLPPVDFFYNNSYHSSINMTPYHVLYGQKCRTPACWLEAGKK